MSEAEDSSCKNHDHVCACNRQTAAQSLQELEFERGIWSAAQHGELDRVKRLVETGKSEVDRRDSAGYTALHYAARNGHLDVCKYLVENGAQIDAITKSGRATALHRACSAGKATIAGLLLSMNAEPNLQDTDGKTALHRASENGHTKICKLLVSRYPNLKNIADNKGHKPKVVD